MNLHNKGKNAYPYVDYAYALTDYKSQGATFDRLVWLAPSGDVNYSSAYVAATRVKEDIKVFTDSADKLIKSSLKGSEKVSTLDLQPANEVLKIIDTNSVELKGPNPINSTKSRYQDHSQGVS